MTEHIGTNICNTRKMYDIPIFGLKIDGKGLIVQLA